MRDSIDLQTTNLGENWWSFNMDERSDPENYIYGNYYGADYDSDGFEFRPRPRYSRNHFQNDPDEDDGFFLGTTSYEDDVDPGTNSHEDNVDPSTSSYEGLLALEEAMGKESKGLDLQSIAALPRFAYASSNSQDNTFEQLQCIVCQLDFEEGEFEMSLCKLPCKHAYHFECIRQWLQCKRNCPICNVEVSSTNQ